MAIKYLTHKEIDFKRWDDAIDHCVNKLVYAKSWYLNIVNPNWDALILGDYEMLMPLTFRLKFGIKYFYKPFFIQFLGVFYKSEDDSKRVPDFISEASKLFRLIDININVSNSNFQAAYTKQRQTQILYLNKPYPELKENYSRSNRKNVNKSSRRNINIEKSLTPDVFIQMTEQMYKERNVIGITQRDYDNLEKLTLSAISKGIGQFYYASIDGEICACAYFLRSYNRTVLQTAVNEKGKESRAIFKIVDLFIQENANTNHILDFAGSNIPGVAEWNMGFGAINQHYCSVYINRLPWYIRLFKK